jgi:hypothetical protein
MWKSRLVSVVGGALAALSALACGTSSERHPMTAAVPSVSGPAAGGSFAAPAAGTPAIVQTPVNTNAGAGGIGVMPSAAGNASGGTSSPGQASAGTSAAAAGTMSAAPGVISYKASIHVPQVQPGEEGTDCIQVRLANTAPVNVVRLHNTLSVASHHFIVSKVTDPAGAEQAIAPCVAFRGAIKGAPLTITQKKDDDIELPAGVAYNLAAGQVMHLELHYLNVGSEPLDVSAETELFAAPAATPLQEATVMLIGTADFSIAPHTNGSTGPKFTALPEEMDGVHFFAITGHTHRFGTDVQVSAAASEGQAGTLLYAPQPFIWDAPEMKRLEPAAVIPAGGGFSYQCKWNNPSEDTIMFGESALAEMCFFWAYYYPKKPVTNVLLDGLDLGLFLGGP